MSLYSIFVAADLIGKIIMLALLSCSLYSIAIIFKYAYFFYVHDALGSDLKLYIPTMNSVSLLNTNPSMYLEIYDYIVRLFIASGKHKGILVEKKNEILDKTEQIFLTWENTMLRDIDNISIIGSIAPFIGLLGTILGIIHSFQSIATAQSSSITVVAPALSEALLVTALGIFVAIPANIGANYFYSKLECTRKNLHVFKWFVISHCSKGENS